jgi:hypothetical protein
MAKAEPSHVGLAFNRKAYRAIAETLASTRTAVEGAEPTDPAAARERPAASAK